MLQEKLFLRLQEIKLCLTRSITEDSTESSDFNGGLIGALR